MNHANNIIADFLDDGEGANAEQGRRLVEISRKDLPIATICVACAPRAPPLEFGHTRLGNSTRGVWCPIISSYS